MGLDLIELVLDVEEAFNISLDNDDVAQIVTVGHFYDLIVRNTPGTKLSGCPTAKAFYHLRRGLVSVLGIPRKDVRPSTSALTLLPFWRRLRIWKRLEQNLALQLPPLGNQAGAAILWTVGIITPISFIVAAVRSGDLFSALAVSIFSLLPSVLFGYIFGILFLPHAPFPQHQTLGGLAKGLVAYNYDKFVPLPESMLENDKVWNKLCEIIVNQLGVKRECLHRETQFVKDLGC